MPGEKNIEIWTIVPKLVVTILVNKLRTAPSILGFNLPHRLRTFSPVLINPQVIEIVYAHKVERYAKKSESVCLKSINIKT